MGNLIDITGYADSYETLCTKNAMEGEYWNVFEDGFFTTYRKTGETEVGDLLQETDVIGWFEQKAELESNVTKPKDGDVYIVGIMAPYTRWKAVVRGVDKSWEEDGEEEKKIVSHAKDVQRLGTKSKQPEEGIYYSVGKAVPFKLFGLVSHWEPVGSFISCVNTRYTSGVGEIAYDKGLWYLHDGSWSWKQITFQEPIANYGQHEYLTKEGTRIRIREGFTLGTLEFYTPRE